MTGSMYASVAGLRAHMQKLTVIGNNVANVNTQGYKKQRTVFRDSVYSMYSSGTDGTGTIGGKNPSQLGYGSLIGSIDLNMSSASYNPGNPTDCALVGDGFFLVGNKEVQYAIDPKTPDSFKSLTLTRVGDFKFGPDNYLVDGQGNVVYGFMTTDEVVDGKHVVSDQLVPIRLPHWEKVPTKETVKDPDNPDQEIERDSYTYKIRYATDKTGTAEAGGAGGADTKTVGPLKDVTTPQDESNWIDKTTGEKLDKDTVEKNPERVAELDFAQFSSISIDAGTGAITGIAKETSEFVTIGYIAIGSVTNPNGVSHIGSSYYRCDAGAGEMRISMLGGVNKELGIENVNSYMAADAADGTGGAGGADAAEKAPLPAGSEVTGTDTEMMTGFLEAPNTDLAEEITELITTQRGYQANTRIITVTDSMLEELVNMKR